MIAFEQHNNVCASLDIGQRKIITDWLDYYDIKNYTINADLSIDIVKEWGNLVLNGTGISKLPTFIKFNRVKNFFADKIDLSGCPLYVEGTYICTHTNNFKYIRYLFMSRKFFIHR